MKKLVKELVLVFGLILITFITILLTVDSVRAQNVSLNDSTNKSFKTIDENGFFYDHPNFKRCYVSKDRKYLTIEVKNGYRTIYMDIKNRKKQLIKLVTFLETIYDAGVRAREDSTFGQIDVDVHKPFKFSYTVITNGNVGFAFEKDLNYSVDRSDYKDYTFVSVTFSGSLNGISHGHGTSGTYLNEYDNELYNVTMHLSDFREFIDRIKKITAYEIRTYKRPKN